MLENFFVCCGENSAFYVGVCIARSSGFWDDFDISLEANSIKQLFHIFESILGDAIYGLLQSNYVSLRVNCEMANGTLCEY